ncbi:MAG TPA: VTC domain-containing protein [Candidatus Paceibacterota bacterium]|nr:VTC domain-containing protein [Verrucomicrobiota bacterium]HRY51748.1 VTC domain-containing protein [Candidatus Paceibacterota bacterium]HSA02396.1 VTC domain-containing protein [Candidatus Paceibacterota bacterium]
MIDQSPHLRFERKFLPAGLSLPEVLALVRRHPALFREVYPMRVVNNIYLDTPGLKSYFDHVHGTANRSKTRVRWYGRIPGPLERPVLEHKAKRGQVSGKISQCLPPLPGNGSVSLPALSQTWEQADLADSSRIALRCLTPSLVNSYQRRYFLSADGRFRLTIDSDLMFGRPGYPSNGSMLSQACQNPAIILELKYAPELTRDAGTVTNAFPFRMSRCSKYVLGLEHIGAI